MLKYSGYNFWSERNILILRRSRKTLRVRETKMNITKNHFDDEKRDIQRINNFTFWQRNAEKILNMVYS